MTRPHVVAKKPVKYRSHSRFGSDFSLDCNSEELLGDVCQKICLTMSIKGIYLFNVITTSKLFPVCIKGVSLHTVKCGTYEKNVQISIYLILSESRRVDMLWQQTIILSTRLGGNYNQFIDFKFIQYHKLSKHIWATTRAVAEDSMAIQIPCVSCIWIL